MSAGYARWLVARGNSFSPKAAAVAKFVDKLRSEGFVSGAGHAIRTVENTFGANAAARAAGQREAQPEPLTAEWLDDPDREEIRLVWPMSAGVKYPLTRAPDPVSFALEVHRAPEFVYPVSETIGRVDSECPCGEDLWFDWDEDEVVPAFAASGGMWAECEDCSRTFDPAQQIVEIVNPFDGRPEEVTGGAAYRFAIKVDCGSAFVADPKLAFLPELVQLVEKEFGRSFHEFGTKYVARG